MLADLVYATWPPLAMAAGIVLVVRAIRFHRAFRRSPIAGPQRALDLVRSFRASLTGLALIGAAAGSLAGIGWLFGLSLIIGGQELLETSIIAAALRDEVERRAREGRRVGGAVAQRAAA